MLFERGHIGIRAVDVVLAKIIDKSIMHLAPDFVPLCGEFLYDEGGGAVVGDAVLEHAAHKGAVFRVGRLEKAYAVYQIHSL